MIEVCDEILNVNDSQTKYFASFVIYNHIRKNIKTIQKNCEVFQKYKEMMLNKIIRKIPLESNLDEKILLNICSGISVLLIYGIKEQWISGIKYIINMSNVNQTNLLYSLMIFGSIAHEFESMDTTEFIIEEMKQYKDIMILFIKDIFPKIIGNKILVKYMINTMISFTKCDVNIIEMNQIGKEIVSLITKYDNSIIQIINELLSEAMMKTKSAKIHRKIDDIISIENILAQCDKNEMNTLNEIIDILHTLINQSQNYSQEILFSISSIFSSICSNFCFLLFYSKTQSYMCQMFLQLISSPILKISSLFIESIEEIKVFINYTNSIYSEQEKEYIINLLFKINDILYANSKLKSLTVNYDSINAYSTTSNLSGITFYNIIDNDNAININDITVYQYRNIIDDTFTDILSMMISLKGASLVNSYIEHLSSFLTNSEDAEKDISSITTSYLISVEAVLFNIRSIVIIFDMPNLSSDILIKFASFVLNSQLILNDKIMLSFMLLLYSMSIYISSDNSFYQNSILFLSKVSISFPLISPISTNIISDIVSHSLSYNEKVFAILCDYYKFNYASINYVTAGNVIESLLTVLLKGNPTRDDVLQTIELIHSRMAYEMNMNDIKKVININSKINNILGRYDNSLIVDNLQSDCIIAYTEKVVNQFIKDNDILQEVVIFYIELCSIIKEKVFLIYKTVEKICNVIINNTNDLYNVIELLIRVYTYYNSNDMMNTLTVLYNKVKADLSNIELLNSFVKFFIVVLSKVDYTIQETSLIADVLNYIMNANKKINEKNLNETIIKCYFTLYSQNQSSLVKETYCESILKNILETFNKYDFEMIDRLTYLMIELYTANTEAFTQVLSQIKNGSLLYEYFSIYHKIKPDRIKSLLNDLMLISQNKISNEAQIMKQYEIEIKKVKIILQKYSNSSDTNIKTKYNI